MERTVGAGMKEPEFVSFRTVNCVNCGERATAFTAHIHADLHLGDLIILNRPITCGWCDDCVKKEIPYKSHCDCRYRGVGCHGEWDQSMGLDLDWTPSEE